MLIACWSAKGGAGTTVVVAGLGLVLTNHRRPSSQRPGRAAADEQALAERQSTPLGLTMGDTLLVDLGGDLPAVLGRPEPEGPGITDWLAAGADVPPDGLARIEQEVFPGLAILPRGSGALGAPERAEVLSELLGADHRNVIIDCGRVEVAHDASVQSAIRDEAAEVIRVLISSATQSVLVTRSCYLALRRYLRMPIRPSGVVVLSEPGRALSALDVEQVCEVPVVAEVSVDPAIARAVDSGLLSQRVPRGLARALLRAA